MVRVCAVPSEFRLTEEVRRKETHRKRDSQKYKLRSLGCTQMIVFIEKYSKLPWNAKSTSTFTALCRAVLCWRDLLSGFAHGYDYDLCCCGSGNLMMRLRPMQWWSQPGPGPISFPYSHTISSCFPNFCLALTLVFAGYTNNKLMLIYLIPLFLRGRTENLSSAYRATRRPLHGSSTQSQIWSLGAHYLFTCFRYLTLSYSIHFFTEAKRATQTMQRISSYTL